MPMKSALNGCNQSGSAPPRPSTKLRSLIQLRPADPAFGLALDEALLTMSRHCYTLRLWRNKLSVIIGRSQHLRDEVDLERCQAENIPIYRRCSGGGTVLHYPGNLNISLIARGQRNSETADAFDAACGQALAQALRRLQIACRYERHGLFAEDGSRKLSGSAQAIRGSGRLYHATLLLSPPPLPMSAVLRAMQACYAPAGLPSRPRETVSINELLNEWVFPISGPLRSGVEAGLGLVPLVVEIVRSFAAMLGIETAIELNRGIGQKLDRSLSIDPCHSLDAVPRLGTITAEERSWAEHLKQTKYTKPTWIYRR